MLETNGVDISKCCRTVFVEWPLVYESTGDIKMFGFYIDFTYSNICTCIQLKALHENKFQSYVDLSIAVISILLYVFYIKKKIRQYIGLKLKGSIWNTQCTLYCYLLTRNISKCDWNEGVSVLDFELSRIIVFNL